MTPAFSSAPFSAIVLSGGRSSRMGSDKALLKIQGQTLLQRTVRLAEQAGADDVLISRNVAGFVQDKYQGLGPLAGLQATLPLCQHDKVLILAVDMPNLSADLLGTLLQHPHGYFAEHPFPAVIARSAELTQQLEQRLNSPTASRSVLQLWQQQQVHARPCPQPEQLLNTNDPASFAAYLQREEPCHAQSS